MADVEDVQDTAVFIKKIVTWEIINVKGLRADIRHNDALGVIKDPHDTRLDYLLEFVDMCREMVANKQGNRIIQLSKDTAMNIHHTCHGMVDLCRHVLATTHEYVCQFTQIYHRFSRKGIFQITSRVRGHIFYISAASP